MGPPPPAVVVHTNGPKSTVPLAAQNALFCIHAATNIEELQSVQIGGSGAAKTGTPATQVADQIGGSARVLPDFVHHSASPSIDVVGVA